MTQKPKIVILLISDLIQEANLHRKAITLRDHGFQVVIFALNHSRLDLTLWQGIELKRIKIKTKFTPIRIFLFIWRATLWLLKTEADLFIAYDAYPLVPLRIKNFIQPCRYFYDSVELFQELNSLVGRPWRRRFWHFYEKLGISGAEQSFTVCSSDAAALKKTYPSLPAPGVVRNIPLYKTVQSSDYLREDFSLTLDTRIGIYQGMIFRGRGLENLIEALPGIDKFALFIVGDGPVKDELRVRAVELGLARQVFFVDAVPFQELSRFTASADIGFTIISGQGLSYIHALPNKLFEYIQAQIPVIGSNYPEISNIIEKEGIGLTVDPHDITSIHRAINLMLDEKVYLNFKKRLKVISRKYTWQEESKEYLRIIRSAFKNPENFTDKSIPE